jgi:hypothetical protein
MVATIDYAVIAMGLFIVSASVVIYLPMFWWVEPPDYQEYDNKCHNYQSNCFIIHHPPPLVKALRLDLLIQSFLHRGSHFLSASMIVVHIAWTFYPHKVHLTSKGYQRRIS